MNYLHSLTLEELAAVYKENCYAYIIQEYADIDDCPFENDAAEELFNSKSISEHFENGSIWVYLEH